MKEQCCFETGFKNAEPQEDVFCGCHEDYDFEWNETENIQEVPTKEVNQNEHCNCAKESQTDTQTQSDKQGDEYEIVDI